MLQQGSSCYHPHAERLCDFSTAKSIKSAISTCLMQNAINLHMTRALAVKVDAPLYYCDILMGLFSTGTDDSSYILSVQVRKYHRCNGKRTQTDSSLGLPENASCSLKETQ